MNYGQKLTQKIAAWVEEGLISPYQAESIHSFEDKHNRVARKSVRRMSLQLVIAFLLSVGGLMVLGSYWNAWLLPFRLLILVATIGLLQFLSLCFFYYKEPLWLKRLLRGWEFSDMQRREFAGVVIWGSALLGMILISQQYPISPPLWEMFATLVWLLLPLMVVLRSDSGSLLVGLLAFCGAMVAPSGYWLFLLFPYWLMPLVWHGRPAARSEMTEQLLYLNWMACVSVVLWPFCHVFWYWPILGIVFYSAATLVYGRFRFFMQILGLCLALGWAFVALWWTVPFAWISMGILFSLLSLWLGYLWLHGVSFGREALRHFLARPLTAVFLFLLWTLLLAGVQTFLPVLHPVLIFCHACLALAVAVRLTWTTDRLFRGLGLSLLVVVVGILLVQPIFPTWIRGVLMIASGFGLWVFLRLRRTGGLSAATFEVAPYGEVGEGYAFAPRFFSKLSHFPKTQHLKLCLALFLMMQLVLIGKPIWIYEGVRLMGDRYLMSAAVQDPYSPFRGEYLQIRMIDFETAWPVLLSPGMRRGYVLLAEDNGIVTPVGLSEKAPEGVYLRLPVKGRSQVSTVTKTPFNRVLISASERQTVLAAVKKDPRVWLHVKMKYGYCLLERITLGEKND